MKRKVVVQKFGGTSMGSVDSIHQVAQHVITTVEQGHHVVVVVSAMSGETNRLLALAKQVDSVPIARELDVLLSSGEQASMAMLAITLNKLGYQAQSLTGAQARIQTDSQHGNATITDIDTAPIWDLLNKNEIVIVAGFQGVSFDGDITTLGRGGSDTSAVTLAGYLGASECQIFTDVDGVYTCDPRLVVNAQKIDVIDFDSMEIMAKKGAKVLHLPCVKFAKRHNLPIRVLSTFESGKGSLVCKNTQPPTIVGIAVQKQMRWVEFCADWSHIDQQSQLVGLHLTNVISSADSSIALIQEENFPELSLVFDEKIHNSEQVSVLTLVGSSTQGLVEEVQHHLATSSINIRHTWMNAHSIELVVGPEHLESAVNLLHQVYFSEDKQRHVFDKSVVTF